MNTISILHIDLPLNLLLHKWLSCLTRRIILPRHLQILKVNLRQRRPRIASLPLRHSSPPSSLLCNRIPLRERWWRTRLTDRRGWVLALMIQEIWWLEGWDFFFYLSFLVRQERGVLRRVSSVMGIGRLFWVLGTCGVGGGLDIWMRRS